MPPFVVSRHALPEADFRALRDGLLGSPLVGRSTLAGGFRASRGFAITFTREGRAVVEQRFPFVAAFLGLAMGRGRRRLLPWSRRLGRDASPNAFFLNLLVVPSGAGVSRHTDGTLRGPGAEDALPAEVTVLYLRVPPEPSGGALALFEGARKVASLRPRENGLVRFRGALAHEVETVEAPEGAVRASLVLEQYRLAESALPAVPAFHIRSNAGFEAYLRDRMPSAEPTGES